MSDFTVQTDYVNLQYQVQKDGKHMDIKLPAKLQAAMIRKVIEDKRNDLMKMFENPEAVLSALAEFQRDGLI